MTDEEMNEFESAIRMRDFAAANGSLIEGNAKAVGVLESLEADIEALQVSGAARVSASGARSDGTADKKVAKDALYELVRRVVKTSATIKREEPGFDNKFKLQSGTLSAPRLLHVARAFATDLPAVSAKFAEYGMSNVVASLNDKINAFEAAQTAQNAGKSSGVAATAQTKMIIKRLLGTRRTLATIVGNILAENPAKLAEWESACRVQSSRKGKTPENVPVS